MKYNYLSFAIKKSKIYYYQVFVEAVVIMILGYLYDKYITFVVTETISNIICSVDYIILLCGLPWVLWKFNKKIKTLTQQKDDKIRYETYIRWVKIRIIVIGGSFLINIALFYFLRYVNILFAAAIAACALLFCKPKSNVIEKEMNPITEFED